MRPATALLLATALVACDEHNEASPSQSSPAATAAPAQAQAPAPAPSCGGKPCLEVPTGIKGLSFGMTPDAARQALKSDSFSELEPLRISPSEAADPLGVALSGAEGTQTLKVRSMTAATTLGGADAHCRLDFGEGGHLVGIACTAHARPDPDALADPQALTNPGRANRIQNLFSDIAAKLTARHGPPATRRERPTESLVGTQASEPYLLRWRSKAAVLTLELGATSPLFGPSQLTLSNNTSAHQARLAAAQKRANQAHDDAIRAAQAAAEAAEKARRRAIEKGREQLDRDLSGAPENVPH